MNILEIKIVKAGTESVVYHNFRVVEDREDDIAAHAAEIIESVTGSDLDADDRADVLDFARSGELSSRFGEDWEFFVEAVVLSFDECDIDEEFDSVHDKYSMVL